MGDAGLQLVEQPHSLLGKRQRELGVSRGGYQRRGRQALRTSASLLDPLGKPCYGGLFEKAEQGQLHLENLAYPRDELGGPQGVAAQLEEVVMDADPRDA